MPCRILVMDPDEGRRERIALTLAGVGHEVRTAPDTEAALARFDETAVDVVVAAIDFSSPDATEWIGRMRRRRSTVSVIALLASPEQEREALRRGIYDFLPSSASPESLIGAVRRAEERDRLHRRNGLRYRNSERLVDDRPIVAASTPMIDLLETMERMAEFKSAVLLSGEPGTETEILARAIHAQSARRHQPFVPLACGALAGERLAAELLGHAREAVQGADRAEPGLISAAHGGTLYLDEVAWLPLETQVEVRNVIRAEEVQSLGSDKPQAVDVRFVIATSRDLAAAVEEGRFSAELLSHLNTSRLDVPPLRRRTRDIPLLVDHFLAHFSRRAGRPSRAIADDALDALVSYPWPGNVSELSNVIERAVLVAGSDRITVRDLPVEVLLPRGRDRSEDGPSALALRPARKALEADYIRRALRATGGNRTHAAELLDISHRALLYKLKEYGIRD